MIEPHRLPNIGCGVSIDLDGNLFKGVRNQKYLNPQYLYLGALGF